MDREERFFDASIRKYTGMTDSLQCPGRKAKAKMQKNENLKKNRFLSRIRPELSYVPPPFSFGSHDSLCGIDRSLLSAGNGTGWS